ncbi:MAG TPA: signal peptidase II, partial [Longimicrobiales bacterium]|nr:signal peptidase II [Longimicrobiales bacterium]
MISAFVRLLRALAAHDVLRFAVLVAAAAFLLDWATKSWALETLDNAAVPLGALMLGVERNDALAFSAGSGRLDPAFVVAVRLLALAGVIALSVQVGARSRRFAAGFALLIAGGSGNAADMLFRGGAVVDFIHAGPF